MSNHWYNISQEVTETELLILPHIRSKKLRSEIISSLFESKSSEYFNSIGIPVQACKTDRDPDLFFIDENKPSEIKVTGCDSTTNKKLKWMGGKYSKRTSEHFFIAYNYRESTIIEPKDEIKYFIVKTFVDENDWKIVDSGKGNYYATIFTSEDILSRDHEILLGQFEMKTFNLV